MRIDRVFLKFYIFLMKEGSDVIKNFFLNINKYYYNPETLAGVIFQILPLKLSSGY